MIAMLLDVRLSLTVMSHALLNEREMWNIDADFNLTPCLYDMLKQPVFLEVLTNLSSIMSPISNAL